MAYTPSMSPEEIRTIDSKRGEKFDDPEDTFPDDDHPKEKKPWLTKTPVNKSGEKNMKATDILKSFFSKSKKDGNYDDYDEDMEKTASMGCGDKEDDDHLDDGLDLMKPKSLDMDSMELDDKELEISDAKKALNSRSMHIPRPPGGYDRFDINRSVNTATTRGHSKLKGPDGVAPLVGESMKTLEDDAIVRTRTGQETYKSCNFHGLVHRASTGCVICSHTLSKSNSCDGCGEEMYKQTGGAFSCKACV